MNSESIRTESSFKGFAKKTVLPIFVSVRQLSRKSYRRAYYVTTHKTIAVKIMCRPTVNICLKICVF